MAEIITKGAIVNLAAYAAGVNGSLTGTNAFDVSAMLQHLEWVVLNLEGQYGVFLGFNKAHQQMANSTDDSGLYDTDAYAVAIILAYRAHAILGIDGVTYERLRRQSADFMIRLASIDNTIKQNNEQLPIGAGSIRYPAVCTRYYRRIDHIDVENDGSLDLGKFVILH